LRPNFADFEQKGLKRARTSRKFVFFSLIPGKSKKYYNVPSDTDKGNFVSKGKNAFTKGKLLGADFFHQRPNFSAKLPRKVCHELATLPPPHPPPPPTPPPSSPLPRDHQIFYRRVAPVTTYKLAKNVHIVTWLFFRQPALLQPVLPTLRWFFRPVHGKLRLIEIFVMIYSIPRPLHIKKLSTTYE
jgi:hypothetical protein